MTFRPLISVCMPVYNTERYLSSAIRGVLDQTYDNFELIICDNCSTDASAKIAQEFTSDRRVRFYENTFNIGYSGNIQKVTSLAKGDLLVVHCADDLMLPHALETYVRTVENVNLDAENFLMMADLYITDEDGNEQAILGKAPGRFANQERPIGERASGERILRYDGHDFLRAGLPNLEFFGWLGSILFPRSFLARTEGYQGGKWISPDQDFMYRVFALNPTVLYIQEPLFKYRQHGSNQLGTERRQAIIKHSMDVYEYTFQYPDSFLHEFGVTREQIQRVFVDRDCLQKALRELAVGSWTLALRYVAFALATYPAIAARNPKLYLALLGLFTGPLGRPFARAGLKGWQRSRLLNHRS